VFRTDKINRITDTTAGVTAHTQFPFKRRKLEPTASRILRKERVPRTFEIARDCRKNIDTDRTETTAGVKAHTYFPLENREYETPVKINAINTSK
jgi:hypothetical protein